MKNRKEKEMSMKGGVNPRVMSRLNMKRKKYERHGNVKGNYYRRYLSIYKVFKYI